MLTEPGSFADSDEESATVDCERVRFESCAAPAALLSTVRNMKQRMQRSARRNIARTGADRRGSGTAATVQKLFQRIEQTLTERDKPTLLFICHFMQRY